MSIVQDLWSVTVALAPQFFFICRWCDVFSHNSFKYGSGSPILSKRGWNCCRHFPCRNYIPWGGPFPKGVDFNLHIFETNCLFFSISSSKGANFSIRLSGSRKMGIVLTKDWDWGKCMVMDFVEGLLKRVFYYFILFYFGIKNFLGFLAS